MIGKQLMKHPYPRKDFYSHLNKGDIGDVDYMHTKRV